VAPGVSQHHHNTGFDKNNTTREYGNLLWNLLCNLGVTALASGRNRSYPLQPALPQ
jgi:hypothetical protein